jgi:hypothetical protein
MQHDYQPDAEKHTDSRGRLLGQHVLHQDVERNRGDPLAAQSTTSDVLGLRLADLELWLDARSNDVRFTLPECYDQFMISGEPGGGLVLRVREGRPRRTDHWRSLFYDAETWQLWLDDAGRYVFAAPRHSPPDRQIAVDVSFSAGEVIGEFGARAAAGRAIYPLQDIDIIILVNWLAETGDLILHASGIDDDGLGYAFVGPPGAGKSTLVAELASRSGVTVLGEDQVILRYREDQFWVYGTPFHTNPARCSPGGVPLSKLFFLDRALGHRVEPCGRMPGMEHLLQDAFIPYYNRAGTERILNTLTLLAEQVPLYMLGFHMGADVLMLIREA